MKKENLDKFYLEIEDLIFNQKNKLEDSEICHALINLGIDVLFQGALNDLQKGKLSIQNMINKINNYKEHKNEVE